MSIEDRAPERIVVDVIQRVYGDATQGALDHRAASEIVTALRNAGWADLNAVGAIIAAAGGRVTITERDMLDDWEVWRSEDHAARGIALEARRVR